MEPAHLPPGARLGAAQQEPTSPPPGPDYTPTARLFSPTSPFILNLHFLALSSALSLISTLAMAADRPLRPVRRVDDVVRAADSFIDISPSFSPAPATN
jgi:hypothetical protein